VTPPEMTADLAAAFKLLDGTQTLSDAVEVVAALQARVTALEDSIARHFTEEHLAGDGPEIDRYKHAMRTGAQQVAYALEAFERGEFDGVTGGLKGALLIWRNAMGLAPGAGGTT